MIISRRFALGVLASPLIALPSADEFWNTEPPESWTPEQIQELHQQIALGTPRHC